MPCEVSDVRGHSAGGAGSHDDRVIDFGEVGRRLSRWKYAQQHSQSPWSDGKRPFTGSLHRLVAGRGRCWHDERMSTDRHSIAVSIDDAGETTATAYGGDNPTGPCFILAHGAGAGQQHPFIVQTSTALAARGITVLTFNFLYMQRGRGGPDRPAVLEATWRAAIRCAVQMGWGSTRLVIGGKSMGGRIASMVLADADAQPLPAPVHGLVLLGYPLHPPGQPDKLRIEHLPRLRTPTLIVQGERDQFGSPGEVRKAFTASPAHVDWLEVPDGDHSFKIRRLAGRTQADVQSEVTDVVAKWILG